MRLWRGGTWNIGSSGFSPMSALQVFATSACLVIDHLAMWFWPPGRQEILGTFVWDYSASPALLAVCWAGLLSAIVVLGVLIAMRSKRKSLACESGVPDDMGIIVFGLCWFVMSFVPMGNFIPVRSGPFADYYLVLPSLGLAAALVAMVRLILRPRAATGTGLSRHAVRVSAVLCAVLLVSRVVFVVTAFKWMTVWNSPKDLLRASMSARAYPYRARANLAKLLEEEGDLEEARRLATESAAEAPWYPLSFNVLGNIEVSEARYQDACAMFMQARELEPGAPYPCFALGFINEIHLGNEQEAATYYRVLLSMGWSRYAETAALNVSRMLALDGQFDEAIQILEAAIERAPYSADLRHNLTVARRQQATAVDQ
jgi:predicted negative regulator of RcsB-dependent stress response